MAKNDSSKKFPVGDHWVAYFKELESSNHRHSAIVAGAMVDTILEEAIRCRLRICPETNALLDWNGGLGSFSARIRFAYATGLIDIETYEEIGRINDIRNRFAHDVLIPDQHHHPSPVSFDSQSIVDKCKNLTFPRIFGDASTDDPDDPWWLFETSVYFIAVRLNAIIIGGQQEIVEFSLL